MKKIVGLLFLAGFLFSSLAFADVLPPFEDQCARYITTNESIEESKVCMERCLKERDGNTFFCKKYSCGDGQICLYTNRDRETHSQRYIEGEKEYIQSTQESMIIKSTIVLLLCAGIFTGTYIYRKRNKKNV